MYKITEEHKKLLLKIVNEWWFKEGVLTYSELELTRKLFHKTNEYNEEERNEMNVVRKKWFDYHAGKYDDKMPEMFRKKQSTLYS